MMTCGSDDYRDLATLSHKTDNLKIQPSQWKNGFSSGLESCLKIKLIRHLGQHECPQWFVINVKSKLDTDEFVGFLCTTLVMDFGF